MKIMWEKCSLPAKIGRYIIKEPIGKGGMGWVFLASDPIINREVAIKVWNKAENDESEEFRKRFMNEVRALGKINSPYIVQIHDAGFYNNLPYMVMEYVDRINLLKHITDKGPMNLNSVINMGIQLCFALEALHSLNIIHRDIKPSNILISDKGGIKITDFSIAKVPHLDITERGEVWGSPSFMSPEQVKGERVDARSDIFSAGAVLYYALSGKKPFEGKDVSEVIYNVLYSQPPDLEIFKRGTGVALKNIIFRALRKKKEERFGSAEEMRKGLEACKLTLPACEKIEDVECKYFNRFPRSWNILAEKTSHLRLKSKEFSPVRLLQRRKKLFDKFLRYIT